MEAYADRILEHIFIPHIDYAKIHDTYSKRFYEDLDRKTITHMTKYFQPTTVPAMRVSPSLHQHSSDPSSPNIAMLAYGWVRDNTTCQPGNGDFTVIGKTDDGTLCRTVLSQKRKELTEMLHSRLQALLRRADTEIIPYPHAMPHPIPKVPITCKWHIPVTQNLYKHIERDEPLTGETTPTNGDFTCVIQKTREAMNDREREVYDLTNAYETHLDRAGNDDDPIVRQNAREALQETRQKLRAIDPLLDGNDGLMARQTLSKGIFSYILGIKWDNSIKIEEMWVSPVTRRTGVASALIEKITQVADDRGIPVYLTAYPFALGYMSDYERAQAFDTSTKYFKHLRDLVTLYHRAGFRNEQRNWSLLHDTSGSYGFHIGQKMKRLPRTI